LGLKKETALRGFLGGFMEVNGKCHCGQIQYRAKIDPENVVICHCTDCQVLTGCAYRISIPTPVGDFKLLTGKAKIYVKVADSGAKRVQAFCPECGTHLYAEALESPTIRSIRVGNLEQRAKLTPRRQIWCRSALPWSQNISAVEPKFDGQGVKT